jgi:hypothetical protein
LGELCREIGETQRCYIDSFTTLSQDFDYRNEAPGLSESVARLKAWYAELDAELRTAISAYSDEELAEKVIDRGGGFKVPVQVQFFIYREALLIFYGKVSVYLKAMERERPEQFRHWIG